MGFWDKMMKQMRRFGSKVAKGVGLRKNGHVKLLRAVKSCEYEDVQILWELLKRNETEVTRAATTKAEKDDCLRLIDWARCPPFLQRA